MVLFECWEVHVVFAYCCGEQHSMEIMKISSSELFYGCLGDDGATPNEHENEQQHTIQSDEFRLGHLTQNRVSL